MVRELGFWGTFRCRYTLEFGYAVTVVEVVGYVVAKSYRWRYNMIFPDHWLNTSDVVRGAVLLLVVHRSFDCFKCCRMTISRT